MYAGTTFVVQKSTCVGFFFSLSAGPTLGARVTRLTSWGFFVRFNTRLLALEYSLLSDMIKSQARTGHWVATWLVTGTSCPFGNLRPVSSRPWPRDATCDVCNYHDLFRRYRTHL